MRLPFAVTQLDLPVNCKETYGDIIRLNLFGVKLLLVLHPEDVEHVLVETKALLLSKHGGQKLKPFLAGDFSPTTATFGDDSDGLSTSFRRHHRRLCQNHGDCADAMCKMGWRLLPLRSH